MAEDYIKRSDVLEFSRIFDDKLWETGGYRNCITEAVPVKAIRNIPSADVAEVVRCKDCKNNYVTTHNHGKQDDPRCDFTDRHLSLDDFCSRGERRMDGGT